MSCNKIISSGVSACLSLPRSPQENTVPLRRQTCSPWVPTHYSLSKLFSSKRTLVSLAAPCHLHLSGRLVQPLPDVNGSHHCPCVYLCQPLILAAPPHRLRGSETMELASRVNWKKFWLSGFSNLRLKLLHSRRFVEDGQLTAYFNEWHQGKKPVWVFLTTRGHP